MIFVANTASINERTFLSVFRQKAFYAFLGLKRIRNTVMYSMEIKQWTTYKFISTTRLVLLTRYDGRQSGRFVNALTLNGMWSRGNMLSSRPRVCGFKPSRGQWMFSMCTNIEHKSSGRGFKRWVKGDFRLVKETQDWKMCLTSY